jgi:hypothetical protein
MSMIHVPAGRMGGDSAEEFQEAGAVAAAEEELSSAGQDHDTIPLGPGRQLPDEVQVYNRAGPGLVTACETEWHRAFIRKDFLRKMRIIVTDSGTINNTARSGRILHESFSFSIVRSIPHAHSSVHPGQSGHS